MIVLCGKFLKIKKIVNFLPMLKFWQFMILEIPDFVSSGKITVITTILKVTCTLVSQMSTYYML